MNTSRRHFCLRASTLALVMGALLPATHGSDDHGQNPSNATLVTAPATVAGNLEISGDIDVFKITLGAASQLSVTSVGTTDVAASLTGAATGQRPRLWQDDADGAGAPNFLLSQTLPAGTYFVAVRGQTRATLGAYSLDFAVGAPTYPDVTLSTDDGQNVAAGATVNLPSADLGQESVREFTIGNAGGAPLLIHGVQISSGNVPIVLMPSTAASLIRPVFRLVTQPAGVVQPGRSTTFRVAFRPTAVGETKASVTVRTNDADEASYAFEVAASGTGAVPTPADIAVSDSGLDVPNNSTVDLGLATAGARISKELLFANVGGTTLSLPIHPTSVRLVSAPPGVTTNPFSLSAATTPVTVENTFNLPSPSFSNFFLLVPGQQKGVSVGLRATIPGSYLAQLSVTTNDPDESPFVITLSATVTEGPNPPEFAATLAGVDVANGAGLDFGATFTGVPVVKTVRVTNAGTSTLRITSRSLEPSAATNTSNGGNARPFRVESAIVGSSALTGSNLAPGQWVEYRLVYSPNATGYHAATLKFFNNDSDENPFTLLLTGHSDVNPNAPDIALTNAGSNLGTGDYLYLGVVTRPGLATKEVTVTNVGQNTLRLTGYDVQDTDIQGNIIASSNRSIRPRSVFSVVGVPPPILAPGQSGTLRLAYTPTRDGTFDFALLTLLSNDPDEGSFRLRLQGASQAGLPTGGLVPYLGGSLTLSGSASTTLVSVTPTLPLTISGSGVTLVNGGNGSGALVGGQLGTGSNVTTQPLTTTGSGGTVVNGGNGSGSLTNAINGGTLTLTGGQLGTI
ncbi:MAG: choice-of-anchor D domain-containing protein, partial [Roseimicrobium sp.]